MFKSFPMLIHLITAAVPKGYSRTDGLNIDKSYQYLRENINI